MFQLVSLQVVAISRVCLGNRISINTCKFKQQHSYWIGKLNISSNIKPLMHPYDFISLIHRSFLFLVSSYCVNNVVGARVVLKQQNVHAHEYYVNISITSDLYYECPGVHTHVYPGPLHAAARVSEYKISLVLRFDLDTHYGELKRNPRDM